MMGRKRNEMMIHELGGDGAGEEGVTRKRQQTLADDDEDGFASDYDMDNTDDEEENAGAAGGGEDESDSDREDEEKLEKSCKWMPPLDLQTYLATSPFATEVYFFSRCPLPVHSVICLAFSLQDGKKVYATIKTHETPFTRLTMGAQNRNFIITLFVLSDI